MTEGIRKMKMKCRVCGNVNQIEGTQGAVAMLATLDRVHDELRPDCDVAKRRARSTAPEGDPRELRWRAIRAEQTWRHCRWSEPHEAVPIDGTQCTQPGTGATEAACVNCGEAIVLQGSAAPEEL
jgi:hypothetical protein